MVCCVIPGFFQPVERRSKIILREMRNKNAENMDTTLAYSGALPLYSFPCFIPFLSHAVPDTELQEGII